MFVLEQGAQNVNTARDIQKMPPRYVHQCISMQKTNKWSMLEMRCLLPGAQCVKSNLSQLLLCSGQLHLLPLAQWKWLADLTVVSVSCITDISFQGYRMPSLPPNQQCSVLMQ